RLARIQNYLGDLLRETGRPREAEESYRAALEIQRKLAADFPLQPEYRRLLAQSHYNLGERLRATGQPRQAEEAYRAPRDAFQRLVTDRPDLPGNPHNLAITLGKLALLKGASRDYASARQLLEQARPHHLATLQANPKSQPFRDA